MDLAQWFQGLFPKQEETLHTARYTLDEIEEYCRDPDSSGCDLDMLDRVKQLKGKNEKAKSAMPHNVRWSPDIDEAVFKTD